MLWKYTDMPPKPYKLFLVKAHYNKKEENPPTYEVVAKSKRGLKKEFEAIFNLHVLDIKEAPKDYQPNKWFIEMYGKERPYVLNNE